MVNETARGSIIATCGHSLAHGEEIVDVRWKDTSIDPISGISNAVAYGSFCPACAREWKERGDLIETDEEANEWLAEGCDDAEPQSTGLVHDADDLAREHDEAVKFIRVIGEELVIAGFAAGDRTMILANIRDLIRRNAPSHTKGGAKPDPVTDEMVVAAMREFEVFAPNRLRYPESEKWHVNDIQGMRAALRKGFEMHGKGK